MARRRRKRINKPVLIVLIVLATLLAAAAVPMAYGFWRYGSAFPGRLVNYFFPKDPAVCERRGDEAYQNGDYRAAAREYRVSADQTGSAAACFKLGRALVELALKAEGLTDTERTEEYQRGLSWLHKATTVDPACREAQELLCELLWYQAAQEVRGVFLRGGDGQDGYTAGQATPGPATPPTAGRRTSVLERYIEAATKLLNVGGTSPAAGENPQNHRTRFRLGLAMAQLYHTLGGSYDEQARDNLERAARLKPAEPRYWLILAEFLASIDRDEEAREALARGLKANPDSPDLFVRRAELLWESGRKADARRLLEQAIARNPARCQGDLALARAMMADGNLSQAEEILQQAKRRLAGKSGDVIQARGRSAAPGGSVSRPPISADPRIYRTLCTIYHRMGRLDKAADELRAGLRALAEAQRGSPAEARRGAVGPRDGPPPAGAPSDTAPPGDRSSPAADSRPADEQWSMTYALASILLDQAQARPEDRRRLVAEARRCLEEMAPLRPGDPHGTKIAGRIALIEGEPAQARRLLEQAWGALRDTSEQQTALLLATLYLHQGRTAQAQAVLDHVLRRPGQTRNVRFLLAKAQIRMKLGDHAGASALVRRVLQVDPQSAEARWLDSALKALAGETTRLPQTLAPTRTIVRQLRDRAETLWFEDQPDEAVRLMEDLHQRVPGDLSILSYLVDLYLAQGRPGAAERVLTKAAAGRPDNDALKFRLELIRQKDPAARLALRRRRAAQTQDPFRRALELADIARVRGRPAEHLEHLAEAARIKPAAPGLARYVLARAIATGTWKIAEECVQLAARADLDAQGGKLFAAELAAARKQYPRAVAILEAILKGSGRHAEARVLLGHCHLAAGRPNEAESAFRTVLEADPGCVQAVIGMVQVTQGPARAKEHAEWAAKALALAPRDPYIRQRHLAARARRAERGEIPALLKECERLLRNLPSGPGLRVEDRPEPRLGLRIIRADLLARGGQTREAEQEYLGIYEQSVRAGRGLRGATLLVGFLIQTDQPRKADAILRSLLKTGKDPVGAYVLYGLALSSHSPAQALAAFSKALEAGPGDPRPHLAISQHHQRQGDWKAAAEAMKAYCDLRGDDLAHRKQLVLLRIEAGQTDLASRRLAEILRRRPDDAEALTLRGSLLRRQGHHEQAAQVFGRAAQADPAHPLPLVLRAHLHLDQGRPQEARADLAQARRRPACGPEVLLQLAMACRRLDDLAAAEAELNDLLRYHQNYLPAVHELVSLYGARQHWWKLEPKLAEARRRFGKDVSLALAEAHMWRARNRQPRALEALASAYRLAPSNPVVIRKYLQALQDAGKFDQVLRESGNVIRAAERAPQPGGPGSRPPIPDRADAGAWVRAVRARALVAADKNADAEAGFLRAVREARAGQIGEVAGLIRLAYGPRRAAGLVADWTRRGAAEWRWHACLGELLALEAGASGGRHLARAVEALRKAADLAPAADPRAATLKRLAWLCAAAGDSAQAVQAYQAALRLAPNDVRALNNLSYLYTDALDRPQDALRHARKAFQLAPGDPNVLDTYGWTLARLGRFDQAEKRLYQAALRGHPTPANRYHLGWVLEHKPNAELAEALKQYTQAFTAVGREKDSTLYDALPRAIQRVQRKMSSS